MDSTGPAPGSPANRPSSAAREAVSIPVPGVTEVPAYALRIEIRLSNPELTGLQTPDDAPSATLRPWKPGDRVILRHSSGPKKVKEILERLKISGPERAFWPVLDWQGTILWMQGVQLESHPCIEVLATPLISDN
jgi:tRNA(Ile)-lysidine synthase